MSVKALAMGLQPQAWRSVAWREGTNAELSGRLTALRVRPAHGDYLQTALRAQEWLLIEWPEGKKRTREVLPHHRPRVREPGAAGVRGQDALAH